MTNARACSSVRLEHISDKDADEGSNPSALTLGEVAESGLWRRPGKAVAGDQCPSVGSNPTLPALGIPPRKVAPMFFQSPRVLDRAQKRHVRFQFGWLVSACGRSAG